MIPLLSKKQIIIVFTFDLLILAFFGPAAPGDSHYWLYRFILFFGIVPKNTNFHHQQLHDREDLDPASTCSGQICETDIR